MEFLVLLLPLLCFLFHYVKVLVLFFPSFTFSCSFRPTDTFSSLCTEPFHMYSHVLLSLYFLPEVYMDSRVAAAADRIYISFLYILSPCIPLQNPCAFDRIDAVLLQCCYSSSHGLNVLKLSHSFGNNVPASFFHSQTVYKSRFFHPYVTCLYLLGASCKTTSSSS